MVNPLLRFLLPPLRPAKPVAESRPPHQIPLPMSAEISTAYEPKSVEEKWYRIWLEQKCFQANTESHKPAYSIVIPPPNVTGVLTMGHVLNNTIQDILARRARALGKEVLWLPGMDHAGIATQNVVEKNSEPEGIRSMT